jgi:uncharacterized membrane protein YedE/YeeE
MAYLGTAFGIRHAALLLVGCAAGLLFYHTAIGFTSSWRQFLVYGQGAGIRAQLLMFAATCLVFFPLLDAGSLAGTPLRGFVAPVGISVIVGAFLFGMGMQLAGGCASGTLYTVGGGNTRMLVALGAFILGAFAGDTHGPWWSSAPALPPFSMVKAFGAPTALLLSFALLATIAAITWFMERRRASLPPSSQPQTHHWLRGPWPILVGVFGLAGVNMATLLLAGRPWGTVSALSLWGAKALSFLGLPVSSLPYWSGPGPQAAIRASVFADITSVMNIGIVLGALGAAVVAGKFAPSWKVPGRSLLAAILGGLLLGYGARIAYGCNIGALFSGIASGSAHGWLWFAAALAGNAAGIRLRPFFGLKV